LKTQATGTRSAWLTL